MSFSDHLENYVLDLLFGNEAYWQPWISVGLSKTNPFDSGVGLLEPSGNGYERVLTDVIDWNYAWNGGVDNAYPVIFPEASGTWGLIAYFALFDEDYFGTMLAYGAVVPNVEITAGLVPSFDTGTLLVLID